MKRLPPPRSQGPDAAGAAPRTPRRCPRLASTLGLAVVCGSIAARPAPGPDRLIDRSTAWFEIQVVDAGTGRGVPLVELRTVNQLRFVTDNAGRVAFGEPGLLDQEVFFHVLSHGYEYPKDGFGYRGVRLHPVAGGRATIRLPRLNIAERLYRITGEGLYRDSVLLGHPTPLRQPLLNGQVLGQDTVLVTPYRGRLYWFWGDTDRAAYPLGNFAASGATSGLPGQGGLDPDLGVDLEYFVNDEGFSKPMCPDFGEGLHWIEAVAAVPDASGTERLVARVSSQKGLVPAHAWHLAVFNDQKQHFESVVRWDLQEGHDAAHPFRTRLGGRDYLYLYPNLRVPAQLEAMKDLQQYEAFTCVAGDGQFRGADTAIDRDDAGQVRYAWKPGATRLHAGRLTELVQSGRLRASDRWLSLQDIETGAPVDAGRGSVCWNAFRQRWVLLISRHPGDLWLAEADTPTGPWAYARRVLTHENYTFYNPTQHPFFDQEGGRRIYFEGTYTDAFSGAKEKTPRYNYNQVMYRLDLADPRLALPVPVYRLRDGRLADRPIVLEKGGWSTVAGIAWFALPSSAARSNEVAIFEVGRDQTWRLTSQRPNGPAAPRFLALPVEASVAGTTASSRAEVPLYEYRHRQTGRWHYSTQPDEDPAEFEKSPAPVCRVWRNPLTVLTLDSEATP